MKSKKERLYIYKEDMMPAAIIPISRKWTVLANAYGDVGSCVVGEGFEFDYEGKQYKLPPLSCWQGSCSWEHCVPDIKKELEFIGCTNVYFNYGNLD